MLSAETSNSSSKNLDDAAAQGINKDEDMLSAAGDLRDDLGGALAEFTFDGTFATAAAYPQAPNPCLMIEGIGGIGLPLSERDAKCIISASTQAPFGHGTETVVDTSVRNTWEIEPAKISFQSALWANFVDKTVVPHIWKALGIAPASTPPRCELYKLLLYETGSHFLPHQDTEKWEGMFATMVVLLPSTYTGGEVRLQHATEEKVFDMSENCTVQTSVLAWYTDVTHSVEPIKSGYRLALSYNLIHTSRNIPTPSLPSTHTALLKLDHILQKWRQNEYRDEDDDEYNMIAYLLQHQYSEADLRRGVKSLKGEDAHKLANVRSVVENLGFLAYLGNLEFNIVGYPEDVGYHSKRGRWDDSSESDSNGDDGQWSMLEETDRHLRIKNMFDLEGQATGQVEFDINDSCLVPKNPFENIGPDDQEYEGYMGNGAGQLDYWYHRTVLVLIPEDKIHDFMFSVYGLEYALPTLRTADPANPAPDMRQLAEKALSRLQSSSKELVGMAQLALKWKDFSMWESICKSSGYMIGLVGVAKYSEAIKVFSFESLRPILEQGLTQTSSMKDRLVLLCSVLSQLPPDDLTGRAWCGDQKLNAISRLVSVAVADVPPLMEIIKENGVQKAIDILLPQLQRLTSISDFWVAFIKTLHDTSRESVEEDGVQANGAWSAAIDASLNAAIDHWVRENAKQQMSRPMGGLYGGRYSIHTPAASNDQRAQTSIDMVDLCLSVGLNSSCQPILHALIKTNGYTANKFSTLYNPLIPLLRQTLEKHQVPITTPPFSNFLRRLIGLYLRDLLGSKEPLIPQMPKVGCGCGDCAPLDGFLKSTQAEYQFKAGQGRRHHVEHQLSPVSHIVTFQTIHQGNPHTLSIRKRPEITEGYQWKKRQSKAKAFLASVGDESLVKEIMGEVCDDVQKALSGIKPFKPTDEQLSNPNPGAGGLQNTSIIAGPSFSARVPESITSIARNTTKGTKRKKSALVSMGPIIDLTSD